MDGKKHFDCAVVIPAYNAAKYLHETLESVLLTQGISVEIIVVDDGSVDDTHNVVSKMTSIYSNVRLIRQINMGVSSARNAGLAVVTASYVCFLDSDDRLRQGGLESLCRLLDETPGAVGAYGAILYIDEDSQLVDYSSKYKTDPHDHVITLDTILQSNFIDTPGAILFRTSAVVRAGAFDTQIRIGEDWELYTRIARLGHFVSCKKEVIDYRIHNTSAMHRKTLTIKDFRPALSKVFHVPATTYRCDSKTLKKYETRKIASIIRLNIILSHGIICQTQHLFQILLLLFSSRFDGKILAITARSILSAAKRLH